MKTSPDEELMGKVRDGDLRLLGSLFERYQGPLLNFFIRLTWDRQLSEDLVQEVFFRILRYRHTYRDNTPFSTWMYQIARNARVDHLRKIKPENPIEEGASGPVDTRPTPAEKLESEQEEALLKRALARLSEDKRELLILCRYQNLKYEQIAELLNCQVSTVKGRVFRAMQELKQHYQNLSGGRQRAAYGQSGD
jgi:RNA polymerase sigma-70 factor (ECF subfamily)